MPDDDDRIIRFPGAGAKKPPAKGKPTPSELPPANLPVDLAGLSEDQRKALSIVMSGMPFVLIGIKATASGADFFTALHGDDGDLRNAASHLPGVIERAYSRRGL
jgi:hypothetical protein